MFRHSYNHSDEGFTHAHSQEEIKKWSHRNWLFRNSQGKKINFIVGRNGSNDRRVRLKDLRRYGGTAG